MFIDTGDNPIVFFDTETTGLDVSKGHRVIELGMVKCFNREPVKGVQEFHKYFKVPISSEPEAFKVHGITDKFLDKKGIFFESFDEIMEFIKDCYLVAHNAKFDVAFIEKEMVYCGYRRKLSDCCLGIIDSLDVARKKYPKKRNGLDYLIKRLKIRDQKRGYHSALEDSKLLAEVYMLMTYEQSGLSLDLDVEDESSFLISEEEMSEISNQLIVISANEDEINAHNEYLNNIGEHCVWNKIMSGES